MISIRRYSDSDKQVWDEFVKNSKNGYFLFLRDYMEYHRDRFSDFSLLFFDTHRLVAVLPANQREGVLYSHQGLTYGGMITDLGMGQKLMLALFDSLIAFARDHQFSRLSYKAIPYFLHKSPAQEDAYALFRQGANVTRVDCSSTIDLRCPVPISSGKRSGARKAFRDGLRIERSYDFETFFDMTRDRLAERHQVQPVHTACEMRLLAERFPNNISLYAGFKEGRMIAGILVYVDGKFAHSQYISSTEEGRRMRAVDAITSFLITDVFTTYNYFDFGVSTVDAGRTLNESLCRQKEEFGARSTVHYFYELDFAC